MKKLYPAYIYFLSFILTAMSSFQVRSQLPDEFQKVDLLTGLANATTMQFAPDGRIFILDRYGEVIIFKTDTQTQILAGSIPVYHEHEDGLLGIAFDPDFLNNNYIYLSFSPEGSEVNRVSRFTMNGDNLILSSEQILLEWPTSRTALWHSGGDMGFDSLGNLFISTGDNATYDRDKYSPQNETNSDFSAEKSSSNTNDLRGKILRITPQPDGTYTIPSGNLFSDGPLDTRAEIYVMGARNPYRFFVDKQNTDWLFWGEVGPDADVPGELGPEGRDEINLTKTAGNYGWPYFSGIDNAAYQIRYANPTYYNNPASPQNISVWNTGLTELPPAREAWLEFFHKSYFAGPRYYYDSNLNDEQRFPAAFDGSFFYYDFNTSRIWTVQMDAQGDIITNERFAESVFPTTRDGFIDMEMGPDGKMYILAYGTGCCPQNAGTGRLIRVDYTGISTNATPTVMISADKNNGTLPLIVNFSSEGTSDPDGDTPLSFSWDFDGDGNPDSTLENPSFEYNNPGDFNVQLRVDDGNGGVGVNNLTIYAGNNTADFNFASPVDGGLVDWGDTVDVNLTVTDVEDGAIDCNEVNLAPGLGHVNHSHPDASQNGCPKTLKVVPTGHSEQGDDVFYVLNADYTDSGGLKSFDQIILHPKRKEAEFFDTQNGTTVIDNTDPSEGGIQALQVDNNAFISYSGRNLTNITGVKYKIAAPTAGGTIELRVGSVTGSLLATTSVPVTGAFDIWEAVTSNFMPPAGKNDIFVVFRSTAGPEDIFNINYVEFLGAGIGQSDSSITITSPANDLDVNQAFEVAFRIDNLKSDQGNGNLRFTIDGGTLEEHQGFGPIPIDGLALGTHTIRLELHGQDETPSGIFDEVTINVIEDISCNETPFPESWTVHQLEENEYTVVYTFADYDLDGDGLKDIVTGGWWFKNPGSASGNWVKSTIGGVFGNVAHVYDFDDDGDLDLLGTTGRYTNAELVWAQNDGAGNFTVFENIPVGDTDYREPFLAGIAGGVFDVGGPYQMAINWNGAESTGSPVQMLTPSADPTTGIWTLEDISQDSSGEDIQAGDIDQDNDLDLFQGINWLRNNGGGNFETFATGIDYNSTPDRAQLADFDRDGDLDAVVGQLGVNGTGNQFEFAWFESQDGDRTQPWTKNILDTGIQGSLSVFATDIDFDGDKDIVVGEWRGEHRLLAFENDLCGSGEFTLRVLDAGGLDLEHHDGARVTDIDNDGDLDVISNGWLNDLIPRIYENTTAPVLDDSPIAVAGDDRSVQPGTEFTLTGSGNDPDGGEIASYLWAIQSSPEGDTATVSGADTTEVTVTDASEGTYIFRLTVTDDEGDTGFDEVTVTVVADGPPTGGNVTRINAGGPAFTFEGNDWAADQNFNGGLDFSNEIEIAGTTNQQLYQTERYRSTGNGSLIYEIPVANGEHSVNLHFAEIYYGVPGDGAAGGAGSRVFNIDVEGQGIIEGYDIFVAAGGGATAVIESFEAINVTDESLTITLVPVTEFPKISGIEIIEPTVASAPVADAGADREITLPTNSVVLTGSGTDADGGEVTFTWTQQSGSNVALEGAETAEISLSNMLPGAYVFRLTVTDDEGETDFDEVRVTVFPEGSILAVAEAAPLTGSSPLEVTFTGSNSMGDITGYLWDFKDGNTSTEADPVHTFISDGTYDVALTVTGAGGMTDTATISIVVSDTPAGEVMGVFLEQNPPKDGTAIIRMVNQPDNLMMLGVNVHDMQGRLLNTYSPEDIVVNDGRYQVPVHILKAGLYFFKIAMNQGEPITLKVLIRN